ncbi:MAG: ABC transporter permease [Deltaproteobacteria bacterium]|nr:ABC transporter permease [Deltaproteobacteria bacterium]
MNRETDGAALVVKGEWSALTVGGVEKRLRRELAGHPPLRAVDLEGVTKLDTTGALLLQEALGAEKNDFITDNPQYKRLLELAVESPGPKLPDENEKPALGVRFLHDLGKTITEEYRLAIQMVGFLGEYIVTCLRLVRRPKALPFTSLVYHMQQVGVSAVPIVSLLAFLIGLVIAYMGAQQLAMFGAEIFTIKLVEITTLRELGVLLTSIVVAGRSGSSFTAQIGAMVANEEVAAMRTMGLSPMTRLAFPRITALVLMLPALVFLADIMSILGGGVAAMTIMDMAPASYAARMQADINLGNFAVGMVKTPFFAVIIGVIGCFQGFQVTGSAESVGRLTTHSVVEAIFMVIVCDAMFALFFTGIGV